MTLAGHIIPGHAEGRDDPVQRCAQDEEARQDPRPAHDLAGDAEWLEVRRGHRELLLREEDGFECDRAAEDVRRDQRSSLRHGQAALDSEREGDVQGGGGEQEGGDVLDRVERHVNAGVGAEPLDENGH